MSEIIVTRGLPASGKSTWAKAWVAADPGKRVRVNRDGIRWTQGIRTGVGSHEEEQKVTIIEEAMVKAALAKGMSVVVDAMHLKAAYVKKWYGFGAAVTVKDFEVPLGELRQRNTDRFIESGNPVTPKVFDEIVKRFHIKENGVLPSWPMPDYGPVFRPYVPGPTPAYSFDIDGTLARMVERGPYDTSLYHTDIADRALSELLWHLQDGTRGLETPVEYLVLSGRDEEFKPVLVEWLKGWSLDIPEENIFMRPKGDLRNDAIIKSELVDKHISGVYDVIMHFDDRNRVVDALRSKGMKVAQVEPGDF